MEKLSVGQREALAEFFANAAVVWLSVGVVTPFFISRRIDDFIAFSIWGLLFALIFLTMSLVFTKGVSS